jgi:hypothetical protein
MSKMKELNEIAQSIADVTLELMYDSVDWQLSEYEADSDDYVAIHAETLQRAVEIMYHQTRKM